ncbi:hypothetical protein ACNAN0_02640 [Agrilactobacillus fermenti]|uniref:hypothetical protein n=1 Tax=Agrilactobacillus fermenti TaxID=2586909 RepID=UPI001E5BF7F0|nr:hypothetical protein [Agrilactobacillus fermenti]MCD2256386.1 hypothetical protein [Agrilactobacillus fermenti]
MKKIIDFFAEGATITAADGSKITTHKQLVDFFQKFFHRNQQLKHIFKISDQDEHYQTEWAVAGQKQDHTLFALHGFDTYTFNASHKISQLKVTVL